MSDLIGFKNDLFESLRKGLEEGLTKQASDGVLSDGDKAFIDQTLVEFEKSAGLGSFIKDMFNAAGSAGAVVSTTTRGGETATNTSNAAAQAGIAMAESFGTTIPRVAVPLGVGMGILAAAKAIGAVSNQLDKNKFDKALADVISRSPTLKEYDPVRVQGVAQSIFRLAPNIATDPQLLGPILESQVKNASGIDMNTLRTLVELEDKIKGRSSSLMKPKDLLAG